MITLEKVSQFYPDGTQGLSEITIKIGEGEFVAVVGPSGAGKSTFLRVLNGVLKSKGGSTNVLGRDLDKLNSSSMRSLKSRIGFIYQQFNLAKTLSVFQNVLVGRLGHLSDLRGALGLFESSDKKLALQYIEEVGLKEKVNAISSRLSGGQQQRVAIARALTQEPKLILADEPMASLDPNLSEVVLGLLKKVNEEKKITVIVNIHVLELAKKYARRIIGINKGKIVFDGTPSDLTETVMRKIYE